MADDSRQLESDLRIALLTGAVGWRDRNSNYSAAEMAVTAVLATAVASVVCILVVSAGLPGRGAAWVGYSRWAAAGLGSLTLLTAAAPTLMWPVGWRRVPVASTWPLVVVRLAAVTTVVGCWTVLLGTAAPWPAWTIGTVLACEVVLTAWSLGLQPRGRDWWRRLQLSGIHLGIVLVSCAVVVDQPDRASEVALVWLTFQVIALGLGVTCWGLNRLREIIEHRAERTAQARAAAAHTDLSKWLHDHITSTIHLVRRKTESGDLGPAQTAAKLAEIEHHLRARQLEELLTSGSSELGDVIGLYLRLARDNDVELAEVPVFSDPGRPVAPRTGRLVNRAFGVLVPNAIAAGAGRLAFRVLAEQGRMVVEVEDDAGGFDLAAAPQGHGLDSLQRDLGDGSLTRVPVAGGSLMRVSIDTEDGVP